MNPGPATLGRRPNTGFQKDGIFVTRLIRSNSYKDGVRYIQIPPKRTERAVLRVKTRHTKVPNKEIPSTESGGGGQRGRGRRGGKGGGATRPKLGLLLGLPQPIGSRKLQL